MRRRHTVGALAVLSLALAPIPATAAGSSAASTAVRFATATPRIPAGAVRLGRLPSKQRLTILIALRPAHADRLASLLHDLHDASSPRFEHWLKTGEFKRQFGPTRAQIERVTSWLHARGLHDTRVDGMAVRVSGDADDLARAFSVSFARYQLNARSTGYSASTAPLVPRVVANDITSIIGLSDTARLHSSHHVASRNTRLAAIGATTNATAARAVPSAGCVAARDLAAKGFWTPAQIGSHYGVDKLIAAGLTGKGKTIALVEFAPSVASYTNTFLSCFGLHNKVTVTKIAGGAPTDPNGTIEAEIDIQEAAAQAPGASLVSYEAPNSFPGEYQLFSRIVSDNSAQVVSTSWGLCEASVASVGNLIDAEATLFQQAAAQGQSVFAASGDSGSEGCYDGGASAESQALVVDHPASDPSVTGVGGTRFQKLGVEPVWNDCEGEVGPSCAQSGGGAAGSGLSAHFGRPSWQPLAPNATCTTCREVPDLSANAGVYETFYNGGWFAVGGTSIAAPTLAGIAADIAQGSKAGRLGDFAPKLSALAAKQVYGSALTDVTTGVNWPNHKVETPGTTDLTGTNAGAFQTAVGYDLATGWGTPRAAGLACPQINSMVPARGKTGTRVTLHGVGLEKATIRFGTGLASVVSSNATTAVVIVPAGSGTVNVSGTDPMGTGNRPAKFVYGSA